MASPSPTRRTRAGHRGKIRVSGFFPLWPALVRRVGLGLAIGTVLAVLGSPVPEAQNGSQTGLQNGSKKGSKFGSKFGSKTRSKFGSKKVSRKGSKKWLKRGQKSGPNGVKIWVQKSVPKGVKKVAQTGSKKWSKRGQNLGTKKCPEMGQKSDTNGVKIWFKRGSNFDTRNGCPEIGVPK